MGGGCVANNVAFGRRGLGLIGNEEASVQTAEAFALLQTLIAVRGVNRVTVWTDSQSCLDMLRQLKWLSATRWLRLENRWIWRLILVELKDRVDRAKEILWKKVVSHVDDKGVEQEQWLTEGNDAADEGAKRGTDMEPWVARLPPGLDETVVVCDGVVLVGDVRKGIKKFLQVGHGLDLRRHPVQGKIARARTNGRTLLGTGTGSGSRSGSE